MITRSITICFALLVAGATVFALAQDRVMPLQGKQPYTPSRLEWLAVELNVNMRISFLGGNHHSLDLVPIEAEDAILIYVRYSPNVNREEMNKNIDTARKVIQLRAKKHGWDGWVKIKEDIEMVENSS